jgi:hypothetical protein
MKAKVLEKMNSILVFALLTVLMLSLTLGYRGVAYSSSSPHSRVCLSLFLRPVSNAAWSVTVNVSLPGLHRSCVGLVEADSYYAETRSISERLLALPLYYILDSVCPGLPADIVVDLERANYNITLHIHYILWFLKNVKYVQP